MKNPTLRRFDQDMKVPGGLKKEFSNRTPLVRSASHVRLKCAVCGLEFSRKASEAKRHSTAYCGRACQGIAQRRQVEKTCRVCGAEYTVKQSMCSRITCCGNACKAALAAEMGRISKLIIRQKTPPNE